MEEILISILGRDESEPFVTDEPLYCAFHVVIPFSLDLALRRPSSSLFSRETRESEDPEDGEARGNVWAQYSGGLAAFCTDLRCTKVRTSRTF